MSKGDTIPKTINEDKMLMSVFLKALIQKSMASAISILRCDSKRPLQDLTEQPTDDPKSWLLQAWFNNLLNRDDFTSIIIKRLRMLLEAKEKREPLNMKSIANSLIQQSVNQANLVKYSTFHRSVINVLKSSIIPILAALCSFMDTNFNLNIILCTPKNFRQTSASVDPCWIVDLWSKMLADPEATPFSYEQVLNLTQDHSTNMAPFQEFSLEVDVLFLPEGKIPVRSPRIPFSFLIYQTVQEVITKVTSSFGTGDSFLMYLHEAEQTESLDSPIQSTESSRFNVSKQGINLLMFFYDTPIGRIIGKFKERDKEILDGYVSDFITMVSQSEFPEEFGIMEIILLSALKYYFEELEAIFFQSKVDQDSPLNQIIKSDLKYLPVLHIAFHRISNRLELLRKLMRIANEGGFLSECATFLTHEKPSRELYNNFDILAASVVLEHLNKQGEEITKKRKGETIESYQERMRNELPIWQQRVKQVELVVLSAFSAGVANSKYRLLSSNVQELDSDEDNGLDLALRKSEIDKCWYANGLFNFFYFNDYVYFKASKSNDHFMKEQYL